MTTPAELAERLETLGRLFTAIYDYAVDQHEQCTQIGEAVGARALLAIRDSLGNRDKVIPEAASLLRSLSEENKRLREALMPFAREAKLRGEKPSGDEWPDDEVAHVIFGDIREGDFRKILALQLECGS